MVTTGHFWEKVVVEINKITFVFSELERADQATMCAQLCLEKSFFPLENKLYGYFSQCNNKT